MKIEIKGLDPLMPQGYVEMIVDQQNVQKIGFNEEIFLTDGKYRLTTQAHSIAREQPIQANVYDKYRLEFVVTSNWSIELIKYGEEVIIYDDGNYSKYIAIVTDVTKEQIAGRIWAVTIEFYDINEANYPGGKIQAVDYLESDYVLNRYGFDATTLFQVWDIGQVPQPFYTIHSILVPDLFTQIPESSEITTNGGVSIHPSVVNKQYVEALFFVHEDDKQNVLSLLPFAGGHRVRSQIRVSGNVYNLLETPEFESTKLNAGNLWQLKIKFMYNIVKHYEYAK